MPNKRNEYHKQWRRDNPDKVRDYRKAYRDAHPEQHKASKRRNQRERNKRRAAGHQLFKAACRVSGESARKVTERLQDAYTQQVATGRMLSHGIDAVAAALQSEDPGMRGYMRGLLANCGIELPEGAQQ